VSYQRRLSLAIVTLILALVVGLSVVYLRYLLGVQVRFALRQAETVAEQLQSTALEQVAADQWPAILQRALGSANIAEIAVTDETGRVQAGTNPGRRNWTNHPSLEDLAGRDFLAQWRALSGPQEYEVNRALAAGGRTVLVVHVSVSASLLRRELNGPIRRLLVAALVSLLASLVLAVGFSRVAFRPLDRLGEAIDRMTRGEWAATPAPTPAARDEYAAISSKLSLLGQQFRDAAPVMTR